jgi:hypothetical protein
VKLNCADAGMSDGMMIRGRPARPIHAFHVLSRPNSSPRLGPSAWHMGPACKFHDAPSPLTSRRHLGSLSTSFARSSEQKPSKARLREGSERARERERERERERGRGGSRRRRVLARSRIRRRRRQDVSHEVPDPCGVLFFFSLL